MKLKRPDMTKRLVAGNHEIENGEPDEFLVHCNNIAYLLASHNEPVVAMHRIELYASIVGAELET